MLEGLAPLLDDEATVVVERSSRSARPASPLALASEKRYGETAVYRFTA